MPDINLLLHLLTKFAWLGNWLFFILAFIESAPIVGVFIPGATLVTVGGLLASQGLLSAWDIIIFSSIGAILGDFFSYSLGRWGGNWIKRNKLINLTLIRHGENFFGKYGNKSIFWGRFFGPIRAIVPFVAGLSKMKSRPFIFWNVVSGVSWAVLNVFLGLFSGSILITIFKKWSGKLTFILLVAITIGLFYWLIKKRGHSIVSSFYELSIKFTLYLTRKNWFNKLNNKYTIVFDFFRENNHAPEKLFGFTLASTFFIIIYLLTIILDVF